MSFFNPFFLYLLPLAVIPLIIHLIGRQRYYRHDFSTLRFLKQLESDLIRKLKIRQILLLVLRTLIILLLVLIFARPYRNTRSPGIVIGKGETLYLVLDNSLSMQAMERGENQLERVKSGLIAAAREIEYPVNVKRILTTCPTRIIDDGLISNYLEFTALLENIRISNRSGNINSALRAILSDPDLSGELNPSIWIASDFQISDIRVEANFKEHFRKINGRLICFPVEPVAENVSIASVAVAGQLFQPNRIIRARARIRNWNPDMRETPVSLYLDDQKLGQALLNVPGSGESFVDFEFLPSAPGLQQVWIQLSDDRLPMDNRRFFSLNIADQINVLIVTRKPEDGRAINRALNAQKSWNILTRMIAADQLATESLGEYSLLIFSNVDELSAAGRTRLDRYLDLNRSLLIFPGEECKIERFNALWADKYGFPRWRNIRRAESGQFLELGDFDKNHPVFNGLLRNKERIEYSPEFYRIPGFSLGRNQHVLGSYDDGTPLLIETPLEKGGGILMASSPVAGWSNLQLTGYFPAVVNRLVIYLSQRNTVQPELFCGDTLFLSPVRLNVQSDLSVQAPDGRRIKIAVGDRDPIVFDDTDLPGFYGVYSEGRRIREYAVNIPESETRPGFMSDADFEALIRDFPAKLDVFKIGQESKLQQMERSRELSNWLIILLLLTALLETYIGRNNREFRSKLQNG